MKKIICLGVILMIVMVSFCACDTNLEEEFTKNNPEEVLENQKNEFGENESGENEFGENESGEDKSGENKSGEIESGEKILSEQSNSNLMISASATALSNEKCAWGFVRKKDSRPEIYAPHAKVLDEFEGIYLGNAEEKVIYLTFDEGYENGYTASILDTLKEKDCPATFFVTKPYVKQNQELVQRMIDEGHIVGNHIPGTSMYHIKIS